MRKGRHLLSLPVVEALTGDHLGEVKELLCDTRECKLLGFVVADGGWIHGAKAVLMPGVQEINNTAVVIADRTFVRDIRDIGELPADSSVRGYTLVTEDGRELGIIRDLVVSPDSGKIEGYELSDGIIDDLLKGRKTVAVYGRVDIVDDQVIVTDAKGESNQ